MREVQRHRYLNSFDGHRQPLPHFAELPLEVQWGISVKFDRLFPHPIASHTGHSARSTRSRDCVSGRHAPGPPHRRDPLVDHQHVPEARDRPSALHHAAAGESADGAAERTRRLAARPVEADAGGIT